MSASTAATPRKSDREGVLAVLYDQASQDRLHGVIREQQLDDELSVEGSLDAALRRIRTGLTPRILLVDLADAAAPMAEISAARAVAGPDVKLVVLGGVNDVGFFRDLLAAGANDYLVKPPTREALAAVLEKPNPALLAGGPDGLGQVVVFLGTRGGVGTTTTAVACAWLLAEEHRARTALVDLDLHFGTIALQLDTDPGHGLCEALEQPSRIDSLFIERAMLKTTENLRVLAAEEAPTDPLMIDAGAIDVLLYELRRKFTWVVVDLPRGATPLQRVVLAAASRVILLCERTLAGLRDTIRLQTLAREQAPQTRLILIEAGAPGERGTVGKAEFEKGIGKTFDGSLSCDPKSAGAATNSGQPLPVATPRSPLLREFRQIAQTIAGPVETPKRRLFALRSLW
jgi:pilus assembly protein CpaE